MDSQTRIYVVVGQTVQNLISNRTVSQPNGRQAAQACHAVSQLRHYMVGAGKSLFEPITTIILQARDRKELNHVLGLIQKKKIFHQIFFDTNEDAYGAGPVFTALACLTTKKQIEGILDYLPLLP